MSWKNNKETIRLNRQRLQEYKQSLKCTSCGLTDHRVIEFHHLGAKDHNVSTMINKGYSWCRIQSEISKCTPLCANCHRVEHWVS